MWIQSRAYTFQQNGAINVDLSALLNAARSMRCPVITAIRGEVTFSLTIGTTATWKQRISALFSQILLKAPDGERINLDGPSVYLLNQMLSGNGCAEGALLTASGTRTGSFYLDLPICPRYSERRADFGINVRELADAGQFQFQFVNATTLGAAQEVTAIGATTAVKWWFWIEEQYEPEIKARLQWTSKAVSLVDDTYPVGGSLYALVMWAGQTSLVAGTTMAARNYISAHLPGYNMVPNLLLREEYKREWQPRISDPLGLATAAVTMTEDLVVAGYADPIFVSQAPHKLVMLPDIVGNCQVRMDVAVPANSPLMISGVITDRQMSTMATVMGAPSVAAMQARLAKEGAVRTLKGKVPLSRFTKTGMAQTIAARLPMKFLSTVKK